jgi:pilus assembly protein CpaF
VISPTSKAKAPVYTVVISEKGGSERREVFDRPELSVGRVQGNDLMLPKGNVSKRHARVLYRDGRFIVTDLNSTNGTYVNRRRISQATIVREGDRIYVGDFVLRIEPTDSGVESAQLNENTGSGPVPVADSASSLEASRVDPPPVEQSEDLPPVPPAPRVPSAPRLSVSSVERAPDEYPSGRMRAAGAEPSRPSAERGSISQEEQVDPDAQAHRIAVSAVVSHAADAVEAGALDRDLTAALRSRIEQQVREQVAAQRRDGQLADGVSDERLTADARAELLELGPLTPLLDSEDVSEVVVARFDRVEVSRGRRLERLEPPFSSAHALNWALARLCRRAGRALGPDEQVVERRLPQGWKLSAVIGPAAASGAMLVLRRPQRLYRTLEELVRQGTISRAIATFLHQCVSARLNILVTGPDDRGRGYVLSALATAAGDSQIVALQDERDVVMHAGAARLAVGDSAEAGRLLRAAAKVPGTRLVAELSTGAAMAAAVEVLAEGGDSVIAELRAPSLRRALARLSAEAARAGTAVPAAREAVANAFDLLLEVVEMRDGRHRVVRVAEPMGTSADEVRTQDVFTFVIERTAAGGAVEGTFSASGLVPRIVEDLMARGLSIENSMFSRPPSR